VNGLPEAGARGGSSKVASVSSVRGSISCSCGPARPTQTVTSRPRASKVIEAHSDPLNDDNVSMPPVPSGPRPTYVSDW
jgi:hypothetical protein